MPKPLIENYDLLYKHFLYDISDNPETYDPSIKVLNDSLAISVNSFWKDSASFALTESRLDKKRGLLSHWPLVQMSFNTSHDRHVIGFRELIGWIHEDDRYSIHYRADKRNPRLAVVEKMLSRDPEYPYPSPGSHSIRIADYSTQQELLDRYGFPRKMDWTVYLSSILCLGLFPPDFVPVDGREICQSVTERLTAHHLRRHPILP